MLEYMFWGGYSSPTSFELFLLFFSKITNPLLHRLILKYVFLIILSLILDINIGLNLIDYQIK